MYKSFKSLKQLQGYEYHVRESSRLQSRCCCIQEHFQWIMQLAGSKWLSHSSCHHTFTSLHLSGALNRSHARYSHTLCAPIQVHNCKHSLQRTNYKTITHSTVRKYTNPIKDMLQTPHLGQVSGCYSHVFPIEEEVQTAIAIMPHSNAVSCHQPFQAWTVVHFQNCWIPANFIA